MTKKVYLLPSTDHLLLSITRPWFKERLRPRQVAEFDSTKLLFSSYGQLSQLLLIGSQHLIRSNPSCILGENSHTAIVASCCNIPIGKSGYPPHRDDRKVESLNHLASFPYPHTPVLSSSHPGIPAGPKQGKAVDVVCVAGVGAQTLPTGAPSSHMGIVACAQELGAVHHC